MTQTIEIPDGFELKQISETEYKLVKIQPLPNTWEEFCKNNDIGPNEAFIDKDSWIAPAKQTIREARLDRMMLPTKEKAEAILALCQLIQLRDCYNRDWRPDWNNPLNKYAICFVENTFVKQTNCHYGRILAFKTAELRDKFFDNFKDLIEKLTPLYK